MEVRVLGLVLLTTVVGTEVFLEGQRLRVSRTAEDGRLHFTHLNADGSVALSSWSNAAVGSEVSRCYESDAELCLQWGSQQLVVFADPICVHYAYPQLPPTDRVEACFEQGDLHWYGGPEQKQHLWPFEKFNFTEYSYVTKELDSMAVVEPYWLLSNGMYIHVDINVPLFISQGNGTFCLIAKNADPYPPTRQTLNFGYYVCQGGENAKEAHRHAVQTFLYKPSGIPDERMVRYPIWSTWARYKRDVDEQTVSAFADEILQFGFNNSQLEIDDLWETCYGSHIVNTTKFPNMTRLTDSLKQRGFRVTMWIHPFINFECEPYFSQALAAGHLVLSTDGNVSTHWWNGDGGHIDITNREAREAWLARLDALLSDAGVDSFKFDAGETSWLPQLPSLSIKEDVNPNQFSTLYAEWLAEYGPMIEVRVGMYTQHLPVYVRMLDKDTRWGFDNGLPTLVTTLLQMNMVGYPFVLPDMVGGNGYGSDVLTKELFIRWLQANVFMPTIQFSFVPWDFDNETVEISRRYTALHAQYADVILDAMRRAASDGEPVNPPVWWVDPSDTVAQGIDSEYLLGEDILVAPVMEEGAVSRDIYLPAGTWRDEVDPGHPLIQGPTWLTGYPAPLDTLPYFTRVASS